MCQTIYEPTILFFQVHYLTKSNILMLLKTKLKYTPRIPLDAITCVVFLLSSVCMYVYVCVYIYMALCQGVNQNMIYEIDEAHKNSIFTKIYIFDAPRCIYTSRKLCQKELQPKLLVVPFSSMICSR